MDIARSIFCAGGGAVMTVTVIHPVDTVKTRLQVSGNAGARDYRSLGLIGTITTVGREEGVAAFWKGIPAAWMREASYTSIRLGLYKPIAAAMNADGSSMRKFAAGCLAGGIGSIVGNPFDVLKTRMMASEGAALSVGATARNIYTTQGVGGFYRGMDANIARAMVNNGTKMACYDVTKQAIKKTGYFKDPNGAAVILSSATIAGFFMTVTVAPFDMVRTQLMNQPVDGPRLYKNFFDCTTKVVASKGVPALWSGFLPMWSRVAPTATLQLFLYEKLMSATGGKAI